VCMRVDDGGERGGGCEEEVGATRVSLNLKLSPFDGLEGERGGRVTRRRLIGK
jgi:hypothetical protein